MKYSIDLTGKSAIVTGAATGIGRAIAMGLAECGAPEPRRNETFCTAACRRSSFYTCHADNQQGVI